MSEAAQQALKILISGEVDPRFNSAFTLADRKLAQLGKDIYDLKKKQDLLKRFEMSTAGIDKTTTALQRATDTAEEMRREISRKTALGEVTGLSKLRRDLQATESHIGDLEQKLHAQKAKWDTYQNELRETSVNLSDVAGEADRTAAALERASKQHIRLENANAITERLNKQNNSSSSGHAMRNLAMGGAAAGYATNETVMAPAIQAATTNEKSIRDIAITGSFANTEKEDQLRAFANQASIDYYQKSGDVIKTVGSLVSQGLDDVSEIKEYAKNAAEAATAWNGNAVEMADLQFAYKKQLGLSKEDMRAALNITATGASQGSFEIKDMAKDMPVITSLLANIGMTGKEAVASGVAALETVRDTKGSSNETTTALAELLRQITSKETANAFKNVSMSHGRVLTEADKKAGEQGANIQELLKEQTSKGFNTLEGFVNITETYMKAAGMSKEVENIKYAKNDEEKTKIIAKLTEAGALSELVSSSEASSALLALIAKKGRYTDIKSKGMDAVANGDKLQGDFNLAADTTSKRLEKVHNQWNALLDTIGTAMQPGTVKKLDMLSAFMDKANTFAADSGKNGFFPTLEKSLGFGEKGGKPADFEAIGKDIGAQWTEMWLDVSNKTPNVFAGALTKLKGWSGAVGDVLSGFFTTANFGAMGQALGKTLGNAIDTAFHFVINDSGKLLSYAATLGKNLLTGGVDLFKGFGDALSNSLSGLSLAGVGESLGQRWSGMWKTILNKTPDVFAWVLDTVNRGATAAAEALGGFLKGADIGGMGRGLGTALAEMFDTALHFLAENGGKLLAAGAGVGEWLIKGSAGVLSGLGDRLATSVSGISWDGIGQSLGKGFSALWVTVFDHAPDVFSWALNTLGAALKTGVDLLTGFIKGADWGAMGASAGKALGDMVVVGVKYLINNGPELLWAVGKLAMEAVAGIIEFGFGLVSGLAESRDKAANDILAWSKYLYNDLLDGIKRKTTEMSKWFGKLWDDAIGYVQKKFDEFIGWFKDLFGGMFSFAAEKTEAFGKWWDDWELADIVPNFDFGIFDTAKDLTQKFVDWWDSISLKSLLPDMSEAAKTAGTTTGQMLNAGMNAVNLGMEVAKSPIVKSVAEKSMDVITGKKSILELLSTDGSKTRVYKNADGSIEKRVGGTASWRNNNPGNLKFEYAGSADKTVKSGRTKEAALAAAQKRYEGVVDLDQFGNAIFATEAMGRMAQAKLLTGLHANKTVEEMLPKYAISDYSGKANVMAYANKIHTFAESSGLNLRGKKIGEMSPTEMDALTSGMKSMEGWKAGDVSILDKFAANGKRATGGPVSAGNFYEVNERGMPELLNIFGKQFLMMGGTSASVQPFNIAANEDFVSKKSANVVPIVTLAAAMAAMPAAAAPAKSAPVYNNNATYTVEVYQMPGEDQAALVRRLEKMIRDLQRPPSTALYDHWSN